MVRDIKILGSKVLRGVSKKVEEVGDEELELIQDMIDTMRVNNGVGLAAPQIGVLKRVVVVEFEDRLFTMINPEILEHFGDKLVDKEGCLSVPTIFEDVSRDEGVVVSWVDRDGKEHVIKARGFLARIFQHEVDHLDGKLFIDYLGVLKRESIKRKIKKLKSEYVI